MKKGKGWHGNSALHKKIGKKGGLATAKRHGKEFFSKIGRKGGRVSGGNFAKNPKRAQILGRLGGKKRSNNSTLDPNLKILLTNISEEII